MKHYETIWKWKKVELPADFVLSSGYQMHLSVSHDRCNKKISMGISLVDDCRLTDFRMSGFHDGTTSIWGRHEPLSWNDGGLLELPTGINRLHLDCEKKQKKKTWIKLKNDANSKKTSVGWGLGCIESAECWVAQGCSSNMRQELNHAFQCYDRINSTYCVRPPTLLCSFPETTTWLDAADHKFIKSIKSQTQRQNRLDQCFRLCKRMRSWKHFDSLHGIEKVW